MSIGGLFILYGRFVLLRALLRRLRVKAGCPLGYRVVFVLVRILGMIFLLLVKGARVRTLPARLCVVPTFVRMIFIPPTSNGFTNVFRSLFAMFLGISKFFPRLYVTCPHASRRHGKYRVTKFLYVFVVLSVTCNGVLYNFYQGLRFYAFRDSAFALHGGFYERGNDLFSSFRSVFVYSKLLTKSSGPIVRVYDLSLTPNCRTLRPRGYAIRPTPRVSVYVISVARLYPYVLVSKWSTFYFCEDYQHSRQGGASSCSQRYMISNIIRVRTRDVYVNMSRVGS